MLPLLAPITPRSSRCWRPYGVTKSNPSRIKRAQQQKLNGVMNLNLTGYQWPITTPLPGAALLQEHSPTRLVFNCCPRCFRTRLWRCVVPKIAWCDPGPPRPKIGKPIHRTEGRNREFSRTMAWPARALSRQKPKLCYFRWFCSAAKFPAVNF